MGAWTVIVEGANTYSAEPARRSARARMERAAYRERGVLIATDYLVNSGGVIFAAQESVGDIKPLIGSAIRSVVCCHRPGARPSPPVQVQRRQVIVLPRYSAAGPREQASPPAASR